MDVFANNNHKEVRCLLGIVTFYLSNKEITKLSEKVLDKRRFLETTLPTYCLNPKNGKVRLTADYLQFVNGFDDEEFYTLFDVTYQDQILSDEIENAYLEDILGDHDYRDMFSNFKPITYKNFHSIQQNDYIAIQVNFLGGGYFEFDDFEMEFGVIGYLNSKLELQLLE
jgi:hypothetical protein